MPRASYTRSARAGAFPAGETSLCCLSPASKPSLGSREVNVSLRAASGILEGLCRDGKQTVLGSRRLVS